jgi:hypothetical protein
MKAVAKATALCLFAILAVGMVLSPLSAQTDSSRLPMKSLTVGNRWVYNFNINFSNYHSYSYNRFYESVIGDTNIEQRHYSKVFSSLDSAVRFERSNDTAVYAWTQVSGEKIVQRLHRDSLAFIRNETWATFEPKNYSSVSQSSGDIFSLFSSRVIRTDTSISSYNSFGSSLYGFSQGYGLEYQRLLGIVSLSESASYRSSLGNYSKWVGLIGWKINDSSIGDTALNPQFFLFLADTAFSMSRQQGKVTIALPIFWDGIIQTRIRPDNYAPLINFSYDSTIIETIRIIDNSVANPLTDSITEKQIRQEYRRTRQGNKVTSSVFIPIPQKSNRGGWAVCTIKPPTSDTTLTIGVFNDSTNPSRIPYGYFKFPIVTQNGHIKITLPTIPVKISVPSADVLNGDTVQIPLIATGMKAQYAIDSTPLPASLSFNASLLEPIGNTQVGTVTNGIRTVPFTFALTPNSDTARAVLLFRAAVGSDTATILTPRIEPQSGINSRTTVTNGYVRIKANQAGGEQIRFFSKAPRLRVLALSPNPASDIISITLSASEKAPVTISLVNTLGQRIRQAEVTLQTGSQEIPFSVRDVPHGVYMIVIQSQSDILTRQVQILP